MAPGYVPLYVVKLDNPGTASFDNPTRVDILIEANNAYSLVSAGKDTAPDPSAANTNTWTATNVLLDSDELTIFEIKTKAADLDDYQLAYLYVYKQSRNTDVQKVTVTYVVDTVTGDTDDFEVQKDTNGVYQLWIPDDVTKIDVEVVAAMLLAKVDIENNGFKTHINKYEQLDISGMDTITFRVEPSDTTGGTQEYKIKINRLELSLQEITAAPSAGQIAPTQATQDTTDSNKYIVRIDPYDNAKADIQATAKTSDNYVRIGYLGRPELAPQGPSESSESFETRKAQYEKDLAAFNAAAQNYDTSSKSVIWSSWAQSANSVMTLPLVTTDGAFTMVKIQVGIANNYVDGSIDDQIGTIKTYNLFVGQKYTKPNVDFYVGTSSNAMKKLSDPVFDESSNTYIYEYGIPMNLPDVILFNTAENVPKAYSPQVYVKPPFAPELNGGDYEPQTTPVTVNIIDASKYSKAEDVPDSTIRIVVTPEAGDSYVWNYEIRIYRLSQDTSVDVDKTTVNDTLHTSRDTGAKIVDYFTVSESTLVEMDGRKYLKVYIKTTSDKAKIRINNKNYVSETDDAPVVDGDTLKGILIPVNDGESEKTIAYTVTSEDNSKTSNNELRVTIQSINTNVEYVQVNGASAFGPYTDERTGKRYFNSFIPERYMRRHREANRQR